MDSVVYLFTASTVMLIASVFISKWVANKRFGKLSKDETINRPELLKVLKERMYGYLGVLLVEIVLVFILKWQLSIDIFADTITALTFSFLSSVILGVANYYGVLRMKFRLLGQRIFRLQNKISQIEMANQKNKSVSLHRKNETF